MNLCLLSDVLSPNVVWRFFSLPAYFVVFCCQTACWEFQFTPPTAPIPWELSVHQVSLNSSLRAMHGWERAAERRTDSLQLYCPWGNCSLFWEKVMQWLEPVPQHQGNTICAVQDVFFSAASPSRCSPRACALPTPSFLPCDTLKMIRRLLNNKVFFLKTHRDENGEKPRKHFSSSSKQSQSALYAYIYLQGQMTWWLRLMNQQNLFNFSHPDQFYLIQLDALGECSQFPTLGYTA